MCLYHLLKYLLIRVQHFNKVLRHNDSIRRFLYWTTYFTETSPCHRTFTTALQLAIKLFKVMKLPWPSLQDCANSMFRALGLNLLTSVYRSLQHLAVGKGYEEHTKIAIRGDRTIASLRTLIHAAPVGVALWEIIINF